MDRNEIEHQIAMQAAAIEAHRYMLFNLIRQVSRDHGDPAAYLENLFGGVKSILHGIAIAPIGGYGEDVIRHAALEEIEGFQAAMPTQ